MLIKKKHKSINKKKKMFVIRLGLFLGIIVISTTCICKARQTSEMNKLQAKKADTVKKQHIVKMQKEKEIQALVAKQLELNKKKNTFSGPPGEFAPWKTKRTDGRKVAYLTFDDGPSVNTTAILKILNDNSIKATFFLVGTNAERNSSLVKKEFNEGHVVGNHTYSHSISYREGTENFLSDVGRCNEVLKSILGPQYNVKLMRFPGGYLGHGNRLVPYSDALITAGYTYVDWNDETGDAEGYNPTVPVLMGNLKKYTATDSVVVLMHDTEVKTNTVQALPQVIQYLKDNGYSFDTIH